MKKDMWAKIESLALEFKYCEKKQCDDIVFDILQLLKGYIKNCVNNAYKSSCLHSTYIPKEDFESNMIMAVWKTLEDFDMNKGKFQGLLVKKIRFAEVETWRQYKVKDSSAKGGKSYVKAQWDYLDRPVSKDNQETLLNTICFLEPSTEETYISNNGIGEIIDEFSRENQRYGNIISFIYEGYEGASLAFQLGEESYNAKIRKTVQRAKQAFKNFMNKEFKEIEIF